MKQIKNLTIKRAEDYIYYNYGYLNHDIKSLVKTSRQMAKKYNCTALDMFFLSIENKPINKLYTHSYGFNTSAGRHIIEEFKLKYYTNLNK
jgi:hypothetical protein|tara:strand:+ start:1247 stop:1519 length:273 start_codon:yes stop_codon:yes gene_type:complete